MQTHGAWEKVWNHLEIIGSQKGERKGTGTTGGTTDGQFTVGDIR